jgi:two-component system chemotaxis response regulator CheB
MENPEFEESRRMLIRTVKLMSEVKVVRRFPGRPGSANRLSKSSPRSAEFRNEVRLIAIGASTGGPVVLQTILSNLPERFPVPVLIVQHIAKGFVKGFRDWLAATSKIDLRIAVDGDILKPGTGYIAPDGHHLGVKNGMRILLKESASDNGICPSADFLFGSVNDQFGASAVGVLLTGMGKDGARELKSMKNAGAVTIVQDEATCVVFGMPGEAVRIGAAEYILAPDKIAKMLTSLIEQ